jgi:hypothetical protein
VLTSLEHIYGHANKSLYKRLRKGFNVWIRGAEESLELSEKLHSFIRASEAVVKPTMIIRNRRAPASKKLKKRLTPITPTFVSRGQTFIGHSRASQRLLNQFYDIRSSVEHIKDIMPKVRPARGISKQDAFMFRALQCEILASAIYSRIFTNPDLMECLSTERKVEGFRRRTVAKRPALWGDAIDLDAEAKRLFFSSVVPEFY